MIFVEKELKRELTKTPYISSCFSILCVGQSLHSILWENCNYKILNLIKYFLAKMLKFKNKLYIVKLTKFLGLKTFYFRTLGCKDYFKSFT